MLIRTPVGVTPFRHGWRKDEPEFAGNELKFMRTNPETHARHTLQQCTDDGCTDCTRARSRAEFMRACSQTASVYSRAAERDSPLFRRRRCQPYEVSTNFLCKYRMRDTLPLLREHTTVNTFLATARACHMLNPLRLRTSHTLCRLRKAI